jgi:hypothetical protein
MRGALLRALALAALVLALANPVANFEDREPVTSVVAIVVDRSPSQMSMDRTARTDAALKALTERLARYPAFESRSSRRSPIPMRNRPPPSCSKLWRRAFAMSRARALPAR